LEAFRFIALRHQRAGISRGQTFLNTGGLSQSLIVNFNVVDNDSPFALSVDKTLRLAIYCVGGAKVSLFLQGVGPLYRQRGVEVSNISIQREELLVVSFSSMLDLIGWVLIILQAPGLCSISSTSWNSRFMVFICWCSRFMVGFVCWCWFVGWGRSVGWCWFVGWSRSVGWCCLVGWLMVCRSGFVGRSRGVCWGWVVAGSVWWMMRAAISFSQTAAAQTH